MRVLIVLGIFGLWLEVNGQAGFATKYYSKTKREVPKEESHYYEISKEDFAKGDSLVTFYTSNDVLRSVSVVNEFGSPDGPFLYYHENGKLKSSGSLKSNWPTGIINSYYPNGMIQAQETFISPVNGSMTSESLIMNYYDSAGNQLVKNGNGRCDCVFESFEWNSFVESGKLVNGKRDSIWTGFDSKIKRLFAEVYETGVLKSGESFDSLGNATNYSQLREPPTYKGGLEALYKSIGKNMKYPKDARKAGLQGTVFVAFVVWRDGSLREINVLKGVNGSLNEEAVRGVGLLNKWIPGKIRGVPVNVKFVLPIKFKI
jgi:TonB family protein